MEKKLNNKEVQRVQCMYVGCKAILSNRDQYADIAQEVAPQLKDYVEQRFEEQVIEELTASLISMFRPDYIKLLLKDLSQISDEDAVEVAKMATRYTNVDWNTTKQDIIELIECIYGQLKVTHQIDEYEYSILLRSGVVTLIHQFLISRGYAVPLWFGIDHPCNGETAITLGLAIKQDI